MYNPYSGNNNNNNNTYTRVKFQKTGNLNRLQVFSHHHPRYTFIFFLSRKKSPTSLPRYYISHSHPRSTTSSSLRTRTIYAQPPIIYYRYVAVRHRGPCYYYYYLMPAKRSGSGSCSKVHPPHGCTRP